MSGILTTWLYNNITKELNMKKCFYLFIIMLLLDGLIGCDSSNRNPRVSKGVVRSPVHGNQTVRLRGENMGNVQSIDLNIALPYNNTTSLMEYQGDIDIHGAIQLDSNFRCLGGNRTPFNCRAEIQNRVIEMPSCNIRGNTFLIRLPFKNSESSTRRYDIINAIVESPGCFLDSTSQDHPYNPRRYN